MASDTSGYHALWRATHICCGNPIVYQEIANKQAPSVLEQLRQTI